MKRILSYLSKYKKESILAPTFKMLEALFDLLVPLVVAQIIDIGIAKNNTTYIWERGGVLLILAIVGLSFSITAQFFAAKAASGCGRTMRHELFSHIQKLSYSQLDSIGSATLITRMTSDINQVQSQTNMALRLLLRSPLIVIGATIMAFIVDEKTALVFVVVIPLLCVVVYGIMLYTIPLYRKIQGRLDKVTGRTRDNLNGIRVIRAFNKEDDEVNKFQEENKSLNRLQLFTGKISVIMNPVTYVIINCGIIGILWVGGERVNNGNLTQGQVVALVNYMSQILIELIKLANLIINLTRAFACERRVEEIFAIPCNVVDEGDLEEGTDKNIAVEFINAGLTYGEAKEKSIEGVNLKVLKGQTVGIIGGTGSGKSSLINMIPRFYDATDGEVKVNGSNVNDYKKDALRNKIGIVPQKAVLFRGTIRSNLLYGNMKASDEDLIQAMKIAQCYDFVMEKENGIDAVVEQNGKNFSGGQKQRLTIARALVRKPEILILDDSSSALDFATDAALRKALSTLENTTVFIVSQRTSAIQGAEQIVVLDDGKVDFIGRHSELLEKSEIYKEIYNSQFKNLAKERA